MSVLRGHEGLDERVCRLRVERQGVAQRRQFGALLQKRLLQPVAACVEVLLNRKQIPSQAPRSALFPFQPLPPQHFPGCFLSLRAILLTLMCVCVQFESVI